MNQQQKHHILALCPSSVQKRTEKSIVRVSAVDASDEERLHFQVFHHQHSSIVYHHHYCQKKNTARTRLPSETLYYATHRIIVA